MQRNVFEFNEEAPAIYINSSVRQFDTKSFIVGTNQSSHITQIYLYMYDEDTAEEYQFPVDPQRPAIYFLKVPYTASEFELKYIYEEGFEREEEM